jgi:hypothetical protein
LPSGRQRDTFEASKLTFVLGQIGKILELTQTERRLDGGEKGIQLRHPSFGVGIALCMSRELLFSSSSGYKRAPSHF